MKWLVLFLLLPIFEIFVFLKVNEVIGLFYIISLILCTALTGMFFVKKQAYNVLNKVKTQRINPVFTISHGFLIFIAGILLVTPGFITDIIGFSVLIPNVRALIILAILQRLNKNK